MLPEHRAEIEKDIRQTQRQRVRTTQPVMDLPAPLAQGLAPQRVRGHHVPTAKREANLAEGTGHASGQLDKKRIDGTVSGIRVIFQNETVVLIGKQEALAAATGTHDNHT